MLISTGSTGGFGMEESPQHRVWRRHCPRLSRWQHRHGRPGRPDQHPGAGQQEPSQGEYSTVIGQYWPNTVFLLVGLMLKQVFWLDDTGQVYDKAESCSITAVTFTRTSELVSSNMRGQLKTWDLRSNSQTAVRTCSQVTLLIFNIKLCLSRLKQAKKLLSSFVLDKE